MATTSASTRWLDETHRMLGLLNAGFPPVHEMSATEAREAIAARVRPVDNQDDVASAQDFFVRDDLRVRVYIPHQRKRTPGPAILYMHGGGFVFCSIESHDGFCRRMSRNTGSVVVSVDYRLAPEHPAPAAAEDAIEAFTWLKAKADRFGVDSDAVIVAGDSAGGNLAAVVAIAARDRGIGAPLGQVLLYPMIAPRFDTPSYVKYADGYYNTLTSMRWYWSQYIADGKLPDPPELVVPSMASSHAGLPRAIVYVAGLDPLASEGSDYASTLKRGGNKVRLRHFPDLFHGFATMPGWAPALSAQQLLWSDIGQLISGGRA